MISLCKNANLKAPEIKETGDSVVLTFYRANFILDNARLNNLSETEKKYLI